MYPPLVRVTARANLPAARTAMRGRVDHVHVVLGRDGQRQVLECLLRRGNLAGMEVLFRVFHREGNQRI